MNGTNDKIFDPSKHLSKVGPADYLQVMWRLVWLRDIDPAARIETQMIELSPDLAVFKARVTLTNGGVATGYGSETPKDFRDYIEKAETKSIGRALAAAGFGTQFSAHEFGGEHENGRIVDAPVAAQNGPGATTPIHQRVNHAAAVRSGSGGDHSTIQHPDAPASDKQLNFIRALAKDHGMAIQGPDGAMHHDEQALAAMVGLEFQQDWPKITKAVASTIIENFQLSRPAQQQSFAAGNADRYTQ